MTDISKKFGAVIKARARVKLRATIVEFIKDAERKGWLFGIDLPEEQIADFMLAILLGEEIRPKDKPKARQVSTLINNAITATRL